MVSNPMKSDGAGIRQRTYRAGSSREQRVSEDPNVAGFPQDGNAGETHDSAMRGGTTEATWFQKVTSALFFGVSSFLLVVVNKWILTTYKFPSVQCVALSQVVSTVVVLWVAKALKIVDYPGLTRDTAWKMMPLPVIFVSNLLFGLGGTSKLSLPMFTVLRRFTILMTMFFEYLILKKVASPIIQGSVYVMILGTVVAALGDLSFDSWGYTFVFMNDFLTATQLVFTKQKLGVNYFGKYGVLYYNSFFMLIPLAILCYCTGEFEKGWAYEHWDDPIFALLFFLSSTMGFILMLSQILCTHFNSALTLTVVGCMKNIITTYAGMFIGGDYVFSWLNFFGLNISVGGSIVYSYVTFKPPPSEQKRSPEHVIEKTPMLLAGETPDETMEKGRAT